MITYKKLGETGESADSKLLETALKIRREMLGKIYSKDESEFEGEFTRLSAEYFTHGNQTTIMAYDGERAIGCATICYITLMPTFDHPTGKRAHLMNVYTSENYRRRGIARQMVTALIDEARERGVTYISLDATEKGRPLYKSLGFCGNEENMGLNL